jgi:predicted phage terminase large subunit-like protein
VAGTDIEDPPNSVRVEIPIHDSGPALWPGYITLPDLEASHRDVGTPIFETMYQGRRGGLAGTIIAPEWFRYYHGNPPGQTYMFVDPAISLKTTADETAIAVANVEMSGTQSRQDPRRFEDLHGTIYYRWIWHGRVGLKDTEDAIVAAWRYYRPVAVGIEATAYQTALVQLIESDHPDLPIEPVTPTKDKLSRFLGLARLYEFGRVYHHPDMKASAAEYQLTHLPNGRHDDIPDAMTGLAEMAGIASITVTTEHRPVGFL